MARVVPRNIFVFFDGEDVSDEFSKTEFHTVEAESDYLSHAESRQGEKVDWVMQLTIAEDHAPGSMWSRMMDTPGTEVSGEYSAYGDGAPSVSEPWWSYTAIISIPSGSKVMGAEADSSPTQASTVDVEWKLKAKPVRVSAPTAPATTATAGSPGSFNGTAPANLAAMSGITASPATAWTTGQHVVLGDASKAHWDGDSWEAGEAA